MEVSPRPQCHTLSPEDYQRLPQLARAYEGSAENEYIRVTPSVLKFPRDDPSLHLGKLVLWNKTKKRVDFRLAPPQSKHFSLFVEKTAIYGGGEETILVKVKPYEERLICTTIQIQVVDCGQLTIPVELLPDTSWFQIPKIIIMPIVPVGRIFEAVIPLPKAHKEELSFFVSRAHLSALTISPTEGRLRDDTGTGTESLLIRFHPREYTTLSHTIFLHFPSIQKRAYDITIYLRSFPTTYDRQEEVCMFPPIPKQPTKRTKLKPIEGKTKEEEDKIGLKVVTEDLSTPAAVAKFLLRPAGKSGSATDLTNVTGLTPFEAYRSYKTGEKKFNEKRAQLQTTRQNLHLQPSRAHLGEEPLTEEQVKEITAERDRQQFLYGKWLGLESHDIEDLTRTKTKVVRRRALRDLDTPYIPDFPKQLTTDWEPLRRHILRPFIQAALTVITRGRADKRIPKLRVLIKQRKEMAELLRHISTNE